MFITKYIPEFIIDLYHSYMAKIGYLLYSKNLNKNMKIIGITGTNGKSTTAYMLKSVLRTAGYKVALISSIEIDINGEKQENKMRMTMPGRFFLHKFLKKASDVNCDFVIIEVTSQGIEQHRHEFIDFDTAIFTNLSPEHIEAHKGFENYKKAKGKFFKSVNDTHIINIDDKNSEYFLSFDSKKKYGYSVNSKKREGVEVLNAENINLGDKALLFKVNDIDFKLKLLGLFNISNAMAVIAYTKSQDISLELVSKALQNINLVEGRMQEVISEPFRVIVDYAFTPEALKKVYESLKPNICILGSCGGGRDKWKRPVLGEIADKYCKHIIVTNEDPYDEDPQEIINQVYSGIKSDKGEKILDRREAIKRALSLLKEGDTMIITGKGSEPSICQNGEKIKWSDKDVILEEFDKR